MTMFQPVSVASDRVMSALIAGLELEFGRGAAEGLASHFLAAEECEFTWDARISERWIGAYEAQDNDDLELDRIAILARINGRWVVAICIVDGDGMAHGMIGRRAFRSRIAALKAFEIQH